MRWVPRVFCLVFLLCAPGFGFSGSLTSTGIVGDNTGRHKVVIPPPQAPAPLLHSTPANSSRLIVAPEPSSVLLFGTGLAAIAGICNRKRFAC